MVSLTSPIPPKSFMWELPLDKAFCVLCGGYRPRVRSAVRYQRSEVDIALNDEGQQYGNLTMKPLPLQGFPAKALLFGVGITNKRQGDYVRAMKREPSDAS